MHSENCRYVVRSVSLCRCIWLIDLCHLHVLACWVGRKPMFSLRVHAHSHKPKRNTEHLYTKTHSRSDPGTHQALTQNRKI